MAFNKAFLVLLMLSLVAVTTHARVDFVGLFVNGHSQYCPPPGPTKCVSCECNEEAGNLVCVRSDSRKGKCPSNCSEGCACDRSLCPRCWCSYEVHACPKICPPPSTTSSTAEAAFENILSFKTD
ncbi:hypothetical protein CsatB_017800 [Cannabis sativa]|uniref:Uncharacterized protein n=1 Tax=Cannabis sativa TaxID=3483 RepID=A0A7J6I9A2_CANSA|nr:hypothetical protein F8388_011220 [Cannabis sativa]KAF4376121.1 hypothetical protein G4B88_025212 [Cannabis sativa]KAF4403250.1 hypothetical protein G4B88_028021 [Cannabis sativa]